MRIIAYYRTPGPVPTSAFIDMAKEAMAAYQKRHPRSKLVSEYFESKGVERLEAAIRAAQEQKAVLVLPISVHIRRNRPFLRALKDSGVDFHVCDNFKLTPATIAEWVQKADVKQASLASKVKEVLAEKKEAGALLGSARPGHWDGRKRRRGWKKAAQVAGENRSLRAREAYKILEPRIFELLGQGRSLAEIATDLNEQGYLTTARKPFNPTAVWRIVDRARKAGMS